MNLSAHINRSAVLHYIIAAIVFSLYGGRVCPFLETITLWQASLYSFVTFTLMYIARLFIIKQQVSLTSIFQEIAIFTAGSIGLSLWYYHYFDFPLESNIKVVFGMICLGILTSIDLSLQNMRLSYPNTLASSELQQHDQRHSIATQMAFLTIFIVLLLSTTLGMIVMKDFHWLAENITQFNHQAAIASVIKEFAFIAIVLITYTVVIMLHWSQLLRLLLTSQQQVLIAAANGDLSARVPQTQQGELGVIAHYTNTMLDKLVQSQDEITQTRDVAIVGLSALAESRDNETGGHILRTQEYVRALAIQLQQTASFKDYLTDDTVDLLYKSAPLHDIGKVGIPDAILLKPGKLTDEEFETMKSHAIIGAESIAVAEEQLGSNSFLAIAREIALTHHEKWDGSGYPNQLQGNEIPLSGRLMALADVYDALISKRVYKPAFSHDKAKAIILEGRDKHFDPEVVDAFLRCEQMFISIAKTYNDDNDNVAA